MLLPYGHAAVAADIVVRGDSTETHTPLPHGPPGCHFPCPGPGPVLCAVPVPGSCVVTTRPTHHGAEPPLEPRSPPPARRSHSAALPASSRASPSDRCYWRGGGGDTREWVNNVVGVGGGMRESGWVVRGWVIRAWVIAMRGCVTGYGRGCLRGYVDFWIMRGCVMCFVR